MIKECFDRKERFLPNVLASALITACCALITSAQAEECRHVTSQITIDGAQVNKKQKFCKTRNGEWRVTEEFIQLPKAPPKAAAKPPETAAPTKSAKPEVLPPAADTAPAKLTQEPPKLSVAVLEGYLQDQDLEPKVTKVNETGYAIDIYADSEDDKEDGGENVGSFPALSIFAVTSSSEKTSAVTDLWYVARPIRTRYESGFFTRIFRKAPIDMSDSVAVESAIDDFVGHLNANDPHKSRSVQESWDSYEYKAGREGALVSMLVRNPEKDASGQYSLDWIGNDIAYFLGPLNKDLTYAICMYAAPPAIRENVCHQ